MSAQIVSNATPGSIEVAIGALVTFANFDNTGVLGWKWTLKDKPAGSTAVLSAQYTSTVTLTPDLAGSYVVELETYTDAARTLLDDFDRELVRCRYTAGYDWSLPGAGEAVQFSASLGWKVEVNRILTDIHDFALVPTALKIAAYSAGFGDLVRVNLAGAAGDVTITPPTAVGKNGKCIGLIVIGAATARRAIFDPAGAETVNGVSTHALSTDYAFALYMSDGTNWIKLRDTQGRRTLADGATINIDAYEGPRFEVTLAGNRILATPTNLVTGQTLELLVQQDATGSRTLAPSVDWIAVDPSITLNPAINTVTLIRAHVSNISGALKLYYTVFHAAEGNLALGVATPQDIGTAAAGNAVAASHENHVHGHGNQAASDTFHALAVASVSHGFVSKTDQLKLNEITVEVTFVTVSGTSKTLALSDRQTAQDCTNVAATTVTVPPNSSVAYNIGTVMELIQANTGQITLAPGAGVTLQSRNSELKSAGQHASIFIKKKATDTWQVTGDKTT